jgi:hypothetical protein
VAINTAAIIALAKDHGIRAMARDDGAAVILSVETIHVVTREEGVEFVEVSSIAAARTALGY